MRCKNVSVFINPYYSKFARVEVADDSVLSHSGNFIEYAVLDEIKSSEFSLGNLITIGAFDKLQYVSLSINSDMTFVDSFSRSYESVQKLQENVQQNS